MCSINKRRGVGKGQDTFGGGVIFFKSMGGWGSLCDMLGGGV